MSVSSAVSSAWPSGPSPAPPNSRLLCPHAVALPSRRGSPGRPGLAWGHPVCDLRPAQAARVPRSPGRARVPPAFRELPDALGELRPGDSESRRGLGLGPGPGGLGATGVVGHGRAVGVPPLAACGPWSGEGRTSPRRVWWGSRWPRWDRVRPAMSCPRCCRWPRRGQLLCPHTGEGAGGHRGPRGALPPAPNPPADLAAFPVFPQVPVTGRPVSR